MEMDRFTLRMPTVNDWENICGCIPFEERKSKLHCETAFPYGDMFRFDFLLRTSHPAAPQGHVLAQRFPDLPNAYAYTANENTKSYLRPVLEAPKALSNLADGSIIRMGNFMLGGKIILPTQEGKSIFSWPDRNQLGGPPLALMPYNTDGVEPISWIKSGNILMADRSLLGNLSFSDMQAFHMVEGIELQMPYQRAVAEYFYQRERFQPDSNARRTGELMHALQAELSADYRKGLAPELTSDELYSLADKAITHYSNRSVAMDDILVTTADFLCYGAENIYYFDSMKMEGCSEDFPAPVLKDVLTSCSQDIFSVLLDEAFHENNQHTITEPDGGLTLYGRAVDLLQQAEKQLEPPKRSIDDLIRNAMSRVKSSDPKRTPDRTFDRS